MAGATADGRNQEGPWDRKHLRWLLAILLVALVLRILWAGSVQPDPRDGRIDDTLLYYLVGRSLADGEGFVDLVEHKPTASYPPGYPVVLGALFRLPADDIATARALNVLLGLAVVVGVYYLGCRLWNQRAGLLAAGMMALFPSHIYFSSLLMKEPLYAALLVGLLCLTVAWTLRGSASAWQVVLLGVVVASATMVRSEALTLAAVIVLAWVLAYRSWRRVAVHAALLTIGMAMLLAPWTVRNAIEVGRPIVTSTGGGVILAEAHNPEAGGRPALELEKSMGWRYEQLYRDLPQPERDLRKDSAAIRDSFEYAVNHIPRELSLAPRRLAWFFRGDRDAVFFVQNAAPGEPGELSEAAADFFAILADSYYYAVAGIAVLALPFWVRRTRRDHVLLWGPLAVYSVLWAFVFAGLSRYHFPLIPIMVLLAAIGLDSLMPRLPLPRK